MIAARTHEISDAGPAFCAALSAPSSQPEPMIEPRETNISPQKPTERCSPGPSPVAAAGLSTCVTRIASESKADN